MFSFIFFAFLFQFSATQDVAQEPVNLHRFSETIDRSAYPDQSMWNKVQALPLTMYQPVHRGTKTEETVIKVAYDDNFFYVAGWLYDSEPDKIVANTLYRDRYSGDETFAVILDTFNDNENARWFFVTPNGVRVDQQISNDSEGGNSINRDWVTFWDAKAEIRDNGWFAQIKVPFSSLGFQELNNEVIMGMIVYRFIARKTERHIFPDIPPVYSRGFSKPSQARKVVLQGVKNRRPVYITPYILGGLNQDNRLNTSGNEFNINDDYVTEAGLDVKVPITANMNIDVTVNTDFAQVEADETQVNLSRFPLFFPEKRRFFQERSDIFSFNLGANNTLFFSRQIGLTDGNQIRILGGARLAGRTGKWDVGILNMQTDKASELDLPSRNFGVYRLSRDIINNNSSVGGMVTTRFGTEGDYHVATGFDFLYNLIEDEYLDFKIATTFDDKYSTTSSLLSNSIVRFNYERRSSEGFYYRFVGKRAGDRYNPQMGFESRFDYTLMDVRLFYGHFSSPDSPIRIITPMVRYFASYRNSDQSLESLQIENRWDFDLKNGNRFNIIGSYWEEDLLNPLVFSNRAFVPSGKYSFYGARVSYSMSSARKLRTSFSARASTFYDGTQYSFSFDPSWNASAHLELSGGAELNILNFPDRNQKEYLNIFRLRSLIALNTQLSLQLFSQYNHLARQFGTNIRFRYHLREGNDLWIVLNEISNRDLNRVEPVLPRFQNRSILIKYTHTFF